jgi:hypothetical protein
VHSSIVCKHGSESYSEFHAVGKWFRQGEKISRIENQSGNDWERSVRKIAVCENCSKRSFLKSA